MVHRGWVGRWQLRISLTGPAAVRLTLVTSGEDQHWVSDGQEVRSYLGTALVSREPFSTSELAGLARWVELVHLDGVGDVQRFQWQELPSAGLLDGAARGLSVRCVRVDCGEYRLFFDGRLRLVAAEGPMQLPGIAARVRARFGDFRRSSGVELPFSAVYTVAGAPLLEERVSDFRIGID